MYLVHNPIQFPFPHSVWWRWFSGGDEDDLDSGGGGDNDCGGGDGDGDINGGGVVKTSVRRVLGLLSPISGGSVRLSPEKRFIYRV